VKKIGITGPTGAGKTTALQALAGHNVCLLDGDQVYHALLAEDRRLQRALTDQFGGEILDKTGGIDRKKLGLQVFGRPAALAELNQVTHRFILAELERRCALAEAEGRIAAVIDAAALFESGIGEQCAAVVGVLAPEDLRIRRIMAREGISEDYARRRAAAQPPAAFYQARCSHILENTREDTPETFRARAAALFRQLLEG